MGTLLAVSPAPLSPASISVIIRARDEAPAIGRCLELLGAQSAAGRVTDTIVLDSGSRDATAEIARRHGAEVIEIPRREFSFGGALNRGARHAQGELLVALSAHAFLPDTDWLARLAGAFDDARVACASGDRHRPDGSPLTAPVDQDIELARRDPQWGYSNAAGGFRAGLWRRHPFREDLPGCEDKVWSWHWLQQGYVCRIDPGLAVEHDHTHDPVASIYRRARREAEGLAAGLGGLPVPGPGELVRSWWSDLRFYDSPLRARLSHRRAARMLGDYAGRRRALRPRRR